VAGTGSGPGPAAALVVEVAEATGEDRDERAAVGGPDAQAGGPGDTQRKAEQERGEVGQIAHVVTNASRATGNR
jgi:hypothetical protein